MENRVKEINKEFKERGLFTGCNKEQTEIIVGLVAFLKKTSEEYKVNNESEDYEFEREAYDEVVDSFKILKQMVLSRYECRIFNTNVDLTTFYPNMATMMVISKDLFVLNSIMNKLLSNVFTLTDNDLDWIYEFLTSSALCDFILNRDLSMFKFANTYRMIPECIESNLLSSYITINSHADLHLTYSCGGHLMTEQECFFWASELYMVINVKTPETWKIITEKLFNNGVDGHIGFPAIGETLMSDGQRVDAMVKPYFEIDNFTKRLTFRAEVGVEHTSDNDIDVAYLPSLSDYAVVNAYQSVMANKFSEYLVSVLEETLEVK